MTIIKSNEDHLHFPMKLAKTREAGTEQMQLPTLKY